MNKSLVTNLLSLIVMAAGWFFALPWLWAIGLFAFSGAVTNWLAIHMLFEKVPLLYGSGVIPARFSEFKQGIYDLIMGQFFSKENLQRLLAEQHEQDAVSLKLAPVIEVIDLSPAFDALLETVQKSSLGGMLAMFGGAQMLVPLKESFIENLSRSLVELADSPEVQQQIKNQLHQGDTIDLLQPKIAAVVEGRLAELTPEMVKDIVQQMIRQHLGWLVVWGGVFGGLIGLLSSFIPAI
ncbi:MAG: DUF445 domain-containing protein [Gammaproteobacteria bacterium]|nr:DUF445 domain-containing protein [Gammaproteobacteria bacterium]MBU2058819.1 DUF445 domain-containing protein [Gammaproteobacteria bacterium]MBU2177118.1 DUF445 domain-containing protein [Gammaproteobacteria bacterium]MBU2247104.1 DUF445 domain-containing protein [Gammaproteobacteria bacterium]MBU2343596.1 DUF445 domain-containing protein [Gammaproteobacteria bacterium]